MFKKKTPVIQTTSKETKFNIVNKLVNVNGKEIMFPVKVYESIEPSSESPEVTPKNDFVELDDSITALDE